MAAYNIDEAKNLVIKAGLELIKSGLVARTWGNISARISETQFVITPSGRAYDTLTTDQIVVVNIADCSYSGDIKPSSEKGIHADVYRLRPSANFIIHTHQKYATMLSILGEDIMLAPTSPLLGNLIPCAPYGISATKPLRRHVAETVLKNPSSPAFLMLSHGALCLGKSFEEAFAVAFELETTSRETVWKRVGVSSDDELRALYLRGLSTCADAEAIHDLGTSVRLGDKFTIRIDGKQKEYPINGSIENVGKITKIHQAIYRSQKIRCIVTDQHPNVVAVSLSKSTMRPSIDDLAQITGIKIKKATVTNAANKVRHRNAVFIHGSGALCTGYSLDEANAVCLVLEKGCEAEMFSVLSEKKHPIAYFDAWLQRTFYIMKYSKMKK